MTDTAWVREREGERGKIESWMASWRNEDLSAYNQLVTKTEKRFEVRTCCKLLYISRGYSCLFRCSCQAYMSHNKWYPFTVRQSYYAIREKICRNSILCDRFIMFNCNTSWLWISLLMMHGGSYHKWSPNRVLFQCNCNCYITYKLINILRYIMITF